jgi:hypothetical protein
MRGFGYSGHTAFVADWVKVDMESERDAEELAFLFVIILV